jgi:RHS repeat-associated protein
LDLNTGLTQVLDNGTTSYTYGLGRISQQSGSTAEYFLGDALGSVRQLTNQAGAITYARTYDPYGVVTTTSGTSQTDYGFTGESYDTYIKLINLRSRMYSPVTGRFLTKDSWLGDYNRPLSLNRWNYVDGNPINRTDRSGKCWYGDVSTGEIKTDPFREGSGPCKDFADAMQASGVDVSTPRAWLDSLPDEVKKYYYACTYKPSLVELRKPYDPNLIGTEGNKGRLIKSQVVSGPEKNMSASGTVTENTDTDGAVGNLVIRFKYHASYIIKVYENAVDLVIGYTFSDRTPDVSHTAATSLGITYQGGKTTNKGLGSLGTGNNIYTSIPFSFYGKSNFPMKLRIDIYMGPTEAELYSPVNTHQDYQFPINPSEIY